GRMADDEWRKMAVRVEDLRAAGFGRQKQDAVERGVAGNDMAVRQKPRVVRGRAAILDVGILDQRPALIPVVVRAAMPDRILLRVLDRHEEVGLLRQRPAAGERNFVILVVAALRLAGLRGELDPLEIGIEYE